MEYAKRAVLYALQGIGISLVMSPLFLYWWIHGDYQRYLWIISGPSPYDKFGGGPYQLALSFGLFLAGALITFAVVMMQKRLLAASADRKYC